MGWNMATEGRGDMGIWGRVCECPKYFSMCQVDHKIIIMSAFIQNVLSPSPKLKVSSYR